VSLDLHKYFRIYDEQFRVIEPEIKKSFKDARFDPVPKMGQFLLDCNIPRTDQGLKSYNSI